MKTKLQNFIQVFKNNPKKSIAGLVAILFVVFGLGNGGTSTAEDVQVVRGDLVSEVSVTGKTKAVESVDLAFETSGKVSSAPFSVGDRVTEGQVLASIDSATLSAELSRANATLAAAEVRLETIQDESSSTRVEAETSVLNAVRDAYTSADDAVRNNIDQFFDNPGTSNASLDISVESGNTTQNFPVNSNLRREINGDRWAIEKLLRAWQAGLVDLSLDSDLKAKAQEAEDNLRTVHGFLDKVALAINSIENTELEYEATVARYRSDVSSARTSVSAALSDILTAEGKLTAAPQNVGGTLDQVLIEQATVAQYRADVESARAALAKATLRSPISGVITKQDATAGEIVTSGESLISVISDDKLEIEANVSEVNIGKVHVGDPVSITFDAFPDRTFTGTLVYIDPGETIIDGVVNFKVKVDFTGDTTDLKSGLTANLNIRTGSKTGVLYIPQYALTPAEDGGFTVDKVVGEEVVKTTVTPGFLGNGAMVEIVSGLSDGETVRVSN